MADMRIDDATLDTNVTGVEKIPVSDAGAARAMTVESVKDFVLTKMAAIAAASGVDVDADGVYLLKDGALKPVDVDKLAAAVLDYGFGKTAVAAINGNEVVGVKDAAAQKTITVSALKAWLEDNMLVTTDIDIGAKSAAGALTDADLIVVAQSGTNKKLTIANYGAWVCGKFKDYLSSLAAVANLTDNDLIYVVNGSEAKKCTIATLKTLIGAGDVTGPTTTTNNNVPQWDTATKKLKDGLSVQGSVRASGTASSTALPTEAAVREAINAMTSPVSSVNTKTGAVVLTGSDIAVSGVDATTIAQKIADIGSAADFRGATEQVAGVHGLVPAPQVQDREKFIKGNGEWSAPPSFVGATASANGVPGYVPAPQIADKAKYLKGDGTWAEVPSDVSGPATTTENKLPQWDATNKKLKDGVALKTAIASTAETASDAAVPTEKAVRTAITDFGGVISTAITQQCATGTDTTATAGKVLVYDSPVAGNKYPFKGGYEVATAMTDTAAAAGKMPTTDAVVGFVGSVAKKVVMPQQTLTDGQTVAITNLTSNLFTIATGCTYTLTLPAAGAAMREFIVAFNVTGTIGETATVNLSLSSGQVVTREGISTALTVLKDATGTAYQCYKFHEDAGEIVCENIFDGGSGSSEVERPFTSTDPTSGGTVNVGKNEFAMLDASALGGESFGINFPVSSSAATVYSAEVAITCGQTLPSAVDLKIANVAAEPIFPEGQTTLVGMLEANKSKLLRFEISGTDTMMVYELAKFAND